jgi:acetyl/propionyl-CoA carboxylase alpha subunit
METWNTVKTLKDIAAAYQNIYEKKEVDPSRDKDGDGDNDFADNMVARMVASGMSREEAIKKVKNKSYNKEEVEFVDEAYETYEFVASYLLENNFTDTIEGANVIINNMSEGWFESIVEEKKPLPVAKMKRKEEKLDRELESELPKALRTEIDSPERKELLRKNRRFGDMHDVRRSVSTRGGKRPLQMPEVGRYKPKDED